MRHISAALTAMRRAPYQTLAAVLILTITYFVGYVFAIVLFSADHLLHYFETRPQVSAFFQVSTKPEEVTKLAETMRQKEYVEHVNIISKEKALELYRDQNKDDPLLLELITADILPASIEVSAKDAASLPKIAEDLHAAEGPQGVDEVVYQKSVVEDLQRWTKSLRYIGIVAVGLLSVTSFVIIMIIVGMKVALKKKAIQIMRILGASGWYIHAPFMWEGILYGLVSSLIGWGLMYVVLLYVTPGVKTFLGAIPLLPLPIAVLLAHLGVGTAVGVVFGSFASSVAVRRMLRRA
jgi:cell division transport system permease protein